MTAAPTFPDYVPTVPKLLADGRDRFGPNDCVVTPTERLTFADLDDRSRRLAARLLGAGVGKSSRVGILFPNGASWVVAWAAAARIGAVVIPVNTFYRPAELAGFLRHADVQWLLGVGTFIQHDYLERLESVAPELADHGPGPLYLPSLPQLRRVLLWGESNRAWAEGGYGADLHNGTSGAGGFGAGGFGDGADGSDLVDAVGAEISPGDEMLVTYTSGSTGEPKGVVHSHGALVRHARNLAALSGLDESSRLWTPMPLCWVGGFAFTLLRALSVGGAFLTQEVFEPAEALAVLSKERVTIVSAWPAVAKLLTEHPDYGQTDLSSIRSGSFYDALPPQRRPPDAGLAVGSLGMSETCGPHTFWTPGEEVTGVPEAYRGAFGHEVPGTEHRIVDPDTGLDLPEGEEGEVLVRGYNLMLGLYKRDRADVFDPDGWYRTGDRGYFRDGWFFFTGRQTDLIKTSGANVAPAEVERCLLAIEEVKLAFVVGVAHPDRGQDVVALVVPWRDDTPDASRLKDRLREELSSYKIPRHVLVIRDESVPWLVSQKVDRKALTGLAESLVAQAAAGAGSPAAAP